MLQIVANKEVASVNKTNRFRDIVPEQPAHTRETTHIQLVPRARAFVESVREETGVPKTEALVRILEWFVELPDELRLAVLNRRQDVKRRLLRTVIAEMADDGEALPATEAESLKLIRKAVAQLERIHAGRARERAGIEPGEDKRRPRKG